ncbi:hypothetical protein EVAR_91864_1, partial [Eumeta japonica]
VKGTGADSTDDDDYCRSRIHSMSNAVQQRIQRMFAELADEATPAQYALPTVFAVHYLGHTPLERKITSLTGLQTPLRDLYLAHRRTPRRSTPPARLEISGGGLRVSDGPDRDHLNPFPTIAVWSAVVCAVQPLDATETDGSVVGVPSYRSSRIRGRRPSSSISTADIDREPVIIGKRHEAAPARAFVRCSHETDGRRAPPGLPCVLMSQQRRCDRNCRDALQSVNGTHEPPRRCAAPSTQSPRRQPHEHRQ